MEILFPDFTYTYAEFFAGCGGLSLGFKMAGLKCISALERDADAAHTFYHNLCYHGWSHVWVDPEDEKTLKHIQKSNWTTSNHLFPNGVADNWLQSKEPSPCLNLFVTDIMKLEPEEWMEICQVRPNDIQIFAGGPPCQGFSTSNVNRSLLDERNQLPLRFIHYCKVCQPNIIFMENVPGIISLGRKKGEKEGPFIPWLREAFEDAGYDMQYQILNAADFGIPQNRRRVIFIAIRKGFKSNFKYPEPTHGNTIGLKPFVNVREAIMNLPPLEAGKTYNGESYSIKGKKGYVICPKCYKHNQEIRSHCWDCNTDLKDAITGGVFIGPGILLIDTNEIED
jgi:site-specific DNA-cytosine methylase